MSKKALVIGAGIHGSTIAIELAKKEYIVTLLDSKADILMGTSSATHNRLHLGYHYPRSLSTAKECMKGYGYFVKNLSDCLTFPDFYYAIERHQSKLNAKQYKDAMEEFGLECITGWPEDYFLNRNNIEECFKVKEACFDLWKLKDLLKKQFSEFKIDEIYNFEIKKAKINKNNNIELLSAHKSSINTTADLIINCTYTYTNNIQKAFSVDSDITTYKFEDTGIAVVESDLIIPALTVMDGPFITILPYVGKKNHYLVYDKLNSVLKIETGTIYNNNPIININWNKMLEHGMKYYPFFESLKYKYSLFGNRPILLEKNDDRSTKIIKHDSPIDFYSIKEGKFISAPVIAKQLCDKL